MKSVGRGFAKWLSTISQPQILFPAFAILALAVIWVTTLNLVKVERTAAERAVLASSREQAGTYEAQVVRILHEIDQTLKVVKYAYEARNEQTALEELKARALLPPELLFTVSIANDRGDIVASNRPSALTNVADRKFFQVQRQGDTLAAARPPTGAGGETELEFSRRLDTADGRFAGIAIVSVGVDYFVSAYDHAKLGAQGVLGILGSDGVFRSRRTGDNVSAGDTVDYAKAVPAVNAADSEAVLTTNVWDGVRRYTTVRQLYDLPAVIIVGLSADEQLAAINRDTQKHLWRAGAGSVALLLVVALLGYMSRQLAQSRLRALEAQVTYAERVKHLAYHDALTALPNRSLFGKLLEQSLSEAQRYRKQLAVLFVDLDRFKIVNDSLGHSVGDKLLVQVAERMRGCVRSADTIARQGGDEFSIMLTEVTKADDASRIAQKIIVSLAVPFQLDVHEVHISASIGIAIYPGDGEGADELLKNADTAMYRAKEQGRDNHQFFLPEMNQRLAQRLQLEADLRRAIERQEFLLHYQPKVELGGGAMCGFEALLRWRHPERGLVSPLEFVPLLEDTGLIVNVGEWVFLTVCEQIRAWQAQGIAALPVAINMSARQFQSQNLESFIAGIDAAGIDPALIKLELTESLLMKDAEEAVTMLDRLRASGVRLSVDDFGTGYSSLAYLKRFPLDEVKIDRAFIRDITTDPDDAEIALSIIKLAHSLNLKVVAEGVETEAQLGFLHAHGCDEIQGYYFAKPLSVEDCTQMLRERRRMQLTAVDGASGAAPIVLLVDDSPADTEFLQRALVPGGYRILVADGSRAAFEMLATHQVSVIISDYNMPGMSGVKFLERVRNLYPQAIRIVISGVGDLAAVVEAVNEASIHKYLSKDWNADRLRTEVRAACLQYRRDAYDDLQRLEDADTRCEGRRSS